MLRQYLSSRYYVPLVLEFYSLVIYLFFQPVFWGKGLLCCFSCIPAWAELSHPLSGGWVQCKLVFCVAFDPWRLSASLQRIRAKMAMNKALAQSRKSQSALFNKPSGTNSLHFHHSQRWSQGPWSVTSLCDSKITSSHGLSLAPEFPLSYLVATLMSVPHRYCPVSSCSVTGTAFSLLPGDSRWTPGSSTFQAA